MVFSWDGSCCWRHSHGHDLAKSLIKSFSKGWANAQANFAYDFAQKLLETRFLDTLPFAGTHATTLGASVC